MMSAVRTLTKEEQALLAKYTIDVMSGVTDQDVGSHQEQLEGFVPASPPPPDGLTREQWAIIKEEERKLDEGLEPGIPAMPYLKKLMAERYGK